MTTRHLVLRSIRYYYRTHIGVVLGVALTSAVVIGALSVGDSVRHTLRRMALARIGEVGVALVSQERFFRQRLADDLQKELKRTAAPVLLLQGTAVANGGAARANHVQIVGVEERFWKLGGVKHRMLDPVSAHVVVNTRLAKQLAIHAGDDLLLKVEKPSLLPRDAPLSTIEDMIASVHVTVSRVASDTEFGRFGLQANQVPPFNAFVPLRLLQEEIHLFGRANVLLVGDSSAQVISAAEADAALKRCFQLADAGLQIRELAEQGLLELRSDRIFIEPAVARVARASHPDSRGVLTYFVNTLQSGARATPYSIVTATDAPPVPAAMPDDAILINQWLADDLDAGVGDWITLRYFVMEPMRKLKEISARFRLHGVIPISGAGADRELMPDFPGLSDVQNCRDWQPGVSVELSRIRGKDEVYWRKYRGTPKAFITLRAGQRLWGNRFGNLTAVRFPLQPGHKEEIEHKIRIALHPASFGLFFQPVRVQALAASSHSQDFGQLFLGFSFFLIASSLLLTALLFALSIEHRREEVGTLLSLGFTLARVRHVLLQEGLLLMLIGVALGASTSCGFTRAFLWGLGTVWREAVQLSGFQYHAEWYTILAGVSASILAGLLVIWILVRRQMMEPPRELLTGHPQYHTIAPASAAGSASPAMWTGVAAIVAVLLIGVATARKDEHASAVFFLAGTLLLCAGVGVCTLLLSPRALHTTQFSLRGLGWRNCTRRRGRSLAVVSLLAASSFVVLAVGANRHNPTQEQDTRSSGTGGFAIIAESTLPVYGDLNDQVKQEQLGLEPDVSVGVRFVPIRVHEGDDASCLNLNRAQMPRILGVRPDELDARRAFTFAQVGDKQFTDQPWKLLSLEVADGVVPAIGDKATVVWGLGGSIGSVFVYRDEKGKDFRLQIVGLLARSILQGSLLISEENFVAHFPSQSGYRMFLVDAPPSKTDKLSRSLTFALEDAGIEVIPAVNRLNELNAVENTYLSIFQALGALGLVLGSIGLGVIVLRNVAERRNELALLVALGFTRRSVCRLIFGEHCILMLLGLGCGLVAAAVAFVPVVSSPGTQTPYVSSVVTLLAVFLHGAMWVWIATRYALSGPMIEALRNE